MFYRVSCFFLALFSFISLSFSSDSLPWEDPPEVELPSVSSSSLLMNLPEELKIRILYHLSTFEDFLSVKHLNKHFYQLTQDSHLVFAKDYEDFLDQVHKAETAKTLVKNADQSRFGALQLLKGLERLCQDDLDFKTLLGTDRIRKSLLHPALTRRALLDRSTRYQIWKTLSFRKIEELLLDPGPCGRKVLSPSNQIFITAWVQYLGKELEKGTLKDPKSFDPLPHLKAVLFLRKHASPYSLAEKLHMHFIGLLAKRGPLYEKTQKMMRTWFELTAEEDYIGSSIYLALMGPCLKG